jgi:uncharacterized protein YjbI with pentapeptide repeats
VITEGRDPSRWIGVVVLLLAATLAVMAGAWFESATDERIQQSLEACRSELAEDDSGSVCFGLNVPLGSWSWVSTVLLSVGGSLFAGAAVVLLIDIYIARSEQRRESEAQAATAERMRETFIANQIRKLTSSQSESRAAGFEELVSARCFTSGELEGRRMDEVDLSMGQLSGARLSNTTLISASLDRAVLIGADLKYAVLIDATLSGANMTKVNLLGARVSESQLQQCGMLWGATMPDGTNYDGRFRLDGDLGYARSLGVDVADEGDLSEFYTAPSGRSPAEPSG